MVWEGVQGGSAGEEGNMLKKRYCPVYKKEVAVFCTEIRGRELLV